MRFQVRVFVVYSGWTYELRRSIFPPSSIATSWWLTSRVDTRPPSRRRAHISGSRYVRLHRGSSWTPSGQRSSCAALPILWLILDFWLSLYDLLASRRTPHRTWLERSSRMCDPVFRNQP